MKKLGRFIIFPLIFSTIYIVGFLKSITENENDKCEMTYMFEFPQYVKISNKVDKKYTKYGLYAYSEGRNTEKARNRHFNGIPVLFIPGNAGSHKQVRSLSSVALRKWLNSRIPHHFDYFTVDLNGEYSGLYGPLLFDQLHYVNASLYRILELYEHQQYPPKSVVIIGHSMGGLIALRLLSEQQQSNLIPIIITLASPLSRPIVNLDYHTNKFYEEILDHDPEMVNVISVGGGYKDLLVGPHLTGKKASGVIHTMTSHIPISWTESNHVQILWCKQVVLALSRALFDSVDLKTHQISANVTYRDMVFRHHLVKHSGTKVRNRDDYFKSVEMNSKGRWIENLRKTYSIEFNNGVDTPHWYMVVISDLDGYEKLSILAINSEDANWVFACNAYYIKQSSRICREGFHLSHKSEIAPSVRYKRKFFHIDMVNLRKYRTDLTHIVFRALPNDEPLQYHVDIHGSDHRSLQVRLPSMFSLSKHVILERTAEKAVYYELMLPQLNNIVQYYTLLLQPVQCLKKEHHASVTLTVPWSSEDYHGFITDSIKSPFNVRLYSSKPADSLNTTAVIKLILDPSCTYRISIQSSIIGVLGQLARIYTPLLLANLTAVALMSFRYQLCNLEKGYCSILFVAIQEGAKPYYVFLVYTLLTHSLSYTHFLPEPDHVQLVNDGVDFLLLPFLLYTVSIGLFWILTAMLAVSLFTLESTIHKISLKLLARTVSFNMAWSDYLMNYLHKVPVVVALTLVSLSVTTCGGLALCLGAVFYFLRLTQMSQDFVEEVVWYTVKRLAKKLKRYFTKSRVNDESNVTRNENIAPERPHDLQTTTELEAVVNCTDSHEEYQMNDSIQLVQKDVIDEEKEINVIIPTREETTEGVPENTDTDYVRSGRIDTLSPQEENAIEKSREGMTENNSEHHNDIVDKQLKQTEPNHAIECPQESSSREQDDHETEGPKPPDDGLDLSSAYNAIHFHTALFFLWCIATVINIPAVLTWAHNFQYSTTLRPDDSLIPGLSLSICALSLWHFDFPKTNRKWMDLLGAFVSTMALITLVFASVSMYRLNYILTLTMLVVTCHQLFAPAIEELEKENPREEIDKYSTSKNKME